MACIECRVTAGLGMKVCAAGLLTKPWDCQASSPSAVPRGPLVLLTPQQGTAHPLLPGGYRALAKALLRAVGTGTVPIAHHLQPQTPSKQPHSQGPFPTDPILPARALPASLEGNLRAQHLYGTLGANEPDAAGASCAHKHSDPSSGRG